MGGLHACGATFRYIVLLPNLALTLLFSKTTLKRKDFQEIARLAWAQEVPSSNLGAPTKSILFVLHYLESHIFLLQLLWISRRQEVGFCKSFNLHDFVALCAGKNSKRQECHYH